MHPPLLHAAVSCPVPPRRSRRTAPKCLPAFHIASSSTREPPFVVLTTVAAGRGSDKLARENIVSRRQSTFLMGLLSNKAPWDTDKDRARR